MLRLRMKVWTDKETGKRYLMPSGFMTSKTLGIGLGGKVMRAYAMSDEDTKLVELTIEDWDKLPFFYFKEDGDVSDTDRPKRAIDVI